MSSMDSSIAGEVVHAESVPESAKTNGSALAGVRRSATIGKLVAALCKAQAEFEPVVKANVNPQFKSKYADLATIIQATMPALSKNELAVIQTPSVNGRELTMTTMLVHSSDEWICNDLTMPATMRNELTAQTIGSACTYSRRYALQSILGIAADLDDDGTEASGGGSREAAKAVGEEKAENLKKSAKSGPPYVPSLFYAWPPSHNGNTAFVSGDKELLSRFKEMLAAKGKWSNAQNAFLVPAESFDDVKFVIEEAAVPFKKLES